VGRRNDDSEEAYVRFAAMLRRAIEFFLAKGCPCRFPRFRALVSRDTRDLGVSGFASPDQQSLCSLFDEMVPVENERCKHCGSHIKRSSEEVFNTSWIERLIIDKPDEVKDIGAPLHAPIPRCRDFFQAVPGARESDRLTLHQAYPKLSEQDFYAWLTESTR
jgi:hypothetical protein